MKNIEYAIVDIETTGGNAAGSNITEIAILIHNGKELIDRWESLINPEKNIPYSIFALTGIDNDLVKDAPVFSAVAEQVFNLLEGRVFVAHNVNFDYSFVRHQLEHAGYKWTAPKLCTVRMSRKIKPGLRSYSLGNLCGDLDISIENRHRAGGDADATAELFEKLLAWDAHNVIADMLKKTSKDQRLPPNLPPEYFEALPEGTGVYYFHNHVGKAIYVGKAVNLKKRVASHFSGHNISPQRQHFLREIYSISFEPCATELMALLLECIEIKRLWPAYNRSLKRFEPKFGLFQYEARNGYQYLAIGKLSKFHQCVHVFDRQYDGIVLLRNLIDEFQLDHRFCKFGLPSKPDRTEDVFEEAAVLPDLAEYNERVYLALSDLTQRQKSFIIIDKGRVAEEQSCIWVEKGNLYAMGYIDAYTQISESEDLKNSLTRYYGNHYMAQLIRNYVEKYPHKVMPVDRVILNDNRYAE
ncbi:DNA polymerase III subunit epsilon [Taibaiella sp. KBW10]|uniref:exonuclease domain-containing protein n=1 Tax=Taibaiella sp. KBW10 TaxID=2153357 RepID=UPI000F596932|nr:exonuclease domain-containing protein [Taibaiella sp. KBW10]RQO31192.1 DNA polymerase III subunit epsilon [Taibaiella sp. KBW10]